MTVDHEYISVDTRALHHLGAELANLQILEARRRAQIERLRSLSAAVDLSQAKLVDLAQPSISNIEEVGEVEVERPQSQVRYLALPEEMFAYVNDLLAHLQSLE